MKTIYLILIVNLPMIASLSFVLFMANAQTPNEDKTFTRCGLDTTLLDSMNLSYDKKCNEEYIVIHNWQDISALNQTTIITDMTSKGFIELQLSNITVGESK